MTNRFLSLLFFAFCSFNLFAQNSANLPVVIPPSPNATALAKFADVPINEYNGLAEISVPFYTIKVGNELSLPISLGYHSGGVKVSEIASWTGLGWSLNAGGVITRSVNGNADEATNGYLNGYVNIPYGSCLEGQEAYTFGYQVAVAKIVDTEPDVFFITLMEGLESL